MRDYLLLYVNGQRHAIRGESAFTSLTDFLRQELQLTGTKVVCAEGDCGACTVLVGRSGAGGLRYETCDACIQFLYQLDCTHVVTVEGLGTAGGLLHPVQEALVEHHGSQCGYCTPGFVMALAGVFEGRRAVDRTCLQTALTGNLCRCTGYLPILEAGLSIEPALLVPLAERYSSAAMIDELAENTPMPVLLQSPHAPGSQAQLGNQAPPRRTFFAPRRFEDAVDFKSRNPEAVIVSGGTELGVLQNKMSFEPAKLLSLTQVPGLNEISCANGTVCIGANATWTQVEKFAKENLPEFYKIVVRFGSPQIRNVATLVANVAHGSPIADALPFLFVMDAELEIASERGTRRAKINGFYKGYKIKDLAADEIITRCHVPLPAADELLRLYKVARRNDLDIATFGAAVRVRRVGDVISRAFISYSGVAAIVVRLPATENFLQGKPFTEQTFRDAGRLARSEIQPISDVRGTRDFRLLLAENILLKFYSDCLGMEHPCNRG
jgi:xanthine dehydrogenase small subunit